VHQLTSAFHTMSLCTRPLLIAGFWAAAGDEEPMLLDSSSTSLTPEQVCLHVTCHILNACWAWSGVYMLRGCYCLSIFEPDHPCSRH